MKICKLKKKVGVNRYENTDENKHFKIVAC